MQLSDIKHVTVCGGGTQGSQIATQVAYKGYPVTVWLRSDASIERAKPRFATMKQQYLSAVQDLKKGKEYYYGGLTDADHLTDEQIDELYAQTEKRLDSIKLTTDFAEAFGNADVVHETIAEDPKQKEDLYTKIAKYLPEHALILTNSSTLMPSQMVSYVDRPDKFLAMHFANQYWIHNLAEVMPQPQTDPANVELVCEYSKSIGMVPLQLKKEKSGYIVNSLLIPWFTAAMSLAANGYADPETIDKTWQLDTGAEIGQTPFHKLDKIGLPLGYAIYSQSPAAKDPDSDISHILAYLKTYIDAGKTGIAAGEGFYKYSDYDK
ncbi:MAG: 3-hydroxyacyl-CoA dehydrogenase [Tractidigestivibacter sp.]|jgi:3-hydroxyacyl-CoA dehydrogenase|uniref:3-hydroxyacyl-CoA dehydrogenase n=1 Tax=Tractidigestivibacter sp. TaxID=2847320 RepID=UPI003D94DFA0